MVRIVHFQCIGPGSIPGMGKVAWFSTGGFDPLDPSSILGVTLVCITKWKSAAVVASIDTDNFESLIFISLQWVGSYTPLAQWKSATLLTRWSQVRNLYHKQASSNQQICSILLTSNSNQGVKSSSAESAVVEC